MRDCRLAPPVAPLEGDTLAQRVYVGAERMGNGLRTDLELDDTALEFPRNVALQALDHRPEIVEARTA